MKGRKVLKRRITHTTRVYYSFVNLITSLAYYFIYAFLRLLTNVGHHFVN